MATKKAARTSRTSGTTMTLAQLAKIGRGHLTIYTKDETVDDLHALCDLYGLNRSQLIAKLAEWARKNPRALRAAFE